MTKCTTCQDCNCVARAANALLEWRKATRAFISDQTDENFEIQQKAWETYQKLTKSLDQNEIIQKATQQHIKSSEFLGH
jgi:hypothetical protein